MGDGALPAQMADLEEGEIEEGELPSEEPEVIIAYAYAGATDM